MSKRWSALGSSSAAMPSAATLRRFAERGESFRLLDPHVRAAGDKELRHLLLAGEQRDLKRRVEELRVRALVDGGASVEQQLRHFDISGEGGKVDRRPPEA